jgi:uncharacterized membrane protein YkoI
VGLMSANRKHEASGRRRLLGLAAVLVAALAVAPLAVARVVPAEPEASLEDSLPTARIAQRGRQVSLQQAIEMAKRRVKGRVVRAETIVRNGRTIHEIRILDEEGRVRTVPIPADGGDR